MSLPEYTLTAFEPLSLHLYLAVSNFIFTFFYFSFSQQKTKIIKYTVVQMSAVGKTKK